MPKFNETLTTPEFAYFEIDDKPYQKGEFLHKVVGTDSLGIYHKEKLSSYNYGGLNWLVEPVIYSDWTNSSGTPYTSLDNLLTDLKAAFFFS